MPKKIPNTILWDLWNITLSVCYWQTGKPFTKLFRLARYTLRFQIIITPVMHLSLHYYSVIICASCHLANEHRVLFASHNHQWDDRVSNLSNGTDTQCLEFQHGSLSYLLLLHSSSCFPVPIFRP